MGRGLPGSPPHGVSEIFANPGLGSGQFPAIAQPLGSARKSICFDIAAHIVSDAILGLISTAARHQFDMQSITFE